MPTETIIRTLKESQQENPKHILPRTVLKAIADENRDFVSSDVTAQDINQLHGKTFVTANAQTLTDPQKAQARANINAAAPDGYYGNSGGVFQYSTNFLGKNAPTAVKDLVFRPTASAMRGTAWSADSIGGDTATIERIKGKTLVWNQLMFDGNFTNADNFTDPSGSGILSVANNEITYTIRTISTTSYDNRITSRNAIRVESGHFCIFSVDVYPKHVCKIRFAYSQGNAIDTVGLPNQWNRIQVLRTLGVIEKPTITMNFYNTGYEVGETVKFRNAVIFDLTQMFGAGNEPATVEEFRAMFPLDYYDYNPGELISFNSTGLQTTGFNQLKPDGTINVIGGMTYRIEGAYTSLVDSAGNAVTVTDNEFTPSRDDTYTMVGGSCVHLKWSGVRDGDTEPYWNSELSLPIATYFEDGMKSAGTVYDELTKDKAVKRIGVVDLGDINWTKYTSVPGKTIYWSPGTGNIKTGGKLILQISDYHYSGSLLEDKSYTTNFYVIIHGFQFRDDAVETAAEFKQKMSGVIAYYELAEPVETPISPELNLTYKVDDFGTEKLLPENTSDPVTTPMDADIVYQLDYEAQVRNNDRINISKASMDNFIASFNASGLGTITQTYNPNTKQYEYTVTAPQSEHTEGGETV